MRVDILDHGSAGGVQSFFEGVMYECTTAGTAASSQPVYDTTVGNTTSDGTAVFTAREAFMHSAVVASVTDRRIFTLTESFPASWVDDFINGGSVIWETGDNKSRVMEVKDWVASSSTITLFLEMGNNIQVGDRLRVFPGCDNKRLSDCKTKFVIPGSQEFANGNVKNFDGEPDVPGPDFVLTYPDAE